MQQKDENKGIRNYFSGAAGAQNFFNPYTLDILASGAPQNFAFPGGRPETSGGAPVPAPPRAPPVFGGAWAPLRNIFRFKSFTRVNVGRQMPTENPAFLERQ